MNPLLLALALQLPTLQSVVDASPPGAVVRTGGTDVGTYLRIDKPLTLIGGGEALPRLELAGTGGLLKIQDLQPAHIFGVGFDELLLVGVHGRTCHAWSSRVTVRGSDFASFSNSAQGNTDGWTGDTTALGALELTALDSSLSNQDVTPTYSVQRIRSVGLVATGTSPVVNVQALSWADDLHVNALDHVPGGTLTLTWNVPRRLSVLYVQLGPPRRWGPWALDSTAIPLVTAGGSGSLTGTLPRKAAFAGETLTFQVYGVNGYHSRPQLVSIR